MIKNIIIILLIFIIYQTYVITRSIDAYDSRRELGMYLKRYKNISEIRFLTEQYFSKSKNITEVREGKLLDVMNIEFPSQIVSIPSIVSLKHITVNKNGDVLDRDALYSGVILQENLKFKIEKSSYYTNVKKNGISKYYSNNGKLKSCYLWINGKKNGLFYEYYPTGVIEFQGRYTNGKKNGAFTYYSKHEKIIKIEIYKMGKILGVELFK